ncbi:uncharacterized protein LOC116948273 [Petromyzon marinus]|uniref:uncharacterized protein LOC116948273 n=1 Tax=Petromyzon marinus TaxID=7757 RepID=UPI003F6F5D2E
MEAVHKEGTPRSTLPKATAPTSSASEQDSGFSDTSSEHHSLVECRDGGVRRQGLDSGDGACGGMGAKPQAVAQSTSTFAQPGLHSFYIFKNIFINQPLCMTSDPQVMHAQLKAWSGDHSQILLVPGPPLATPHEQQLLPPSPSSQPKPCAYQPQAKTSGYLPIFNSYQRIAPRPGKAEGAAPESVVPPSPLSPLLPSGSPPPPPPPPPQSRVDGGPWSGKRPQFANGEGARAFIASAAGAASPMPPQQQHQQQQSKKKGSVVTMRDTHLTPRSKHQHAAQQEQHQRHRQKHSRSRHRHMKKVSHRDRTPLSQQFTTLVSLLNSAGPSIPIAPLAEPRGAALGMAGAAGAAGAPEEEVVVAVVATAVSAAAPPPCAAFPPRSPAVSPLCSPAPCKVVADDPLLPAAMVPFIAPCVPVPVLCEDELQTMDFLDEVLPLGPEGMGAAAGGHVHGGEEQSRGSNGSGDAAGADQGGGGGSSDGFSAGGHEQRFHNTVSILSRSGLLDITMRTKDLLRRNGQAQRELEHLRQLARLFCRAARSPEPSAWDSLQEAMGALGGSAEPAAAATSSSSSSSSSLSSSIAEVGGPGSQDTGLVGCDGGGGGGGGNVGEACLPWAALTDASCQGSIGVVTSWAA